MLSSTPHRGASIASAAAAVAVHQRARAIGDDIGLDDVHIDSRDVTVGSLFVAIRGANVDGHDFVASAITSGAAGVAVEESPSVDIPHLLVADTREALGWIAADVHGYPSRRLGVIGITGTNGKTTVAHMLAAITDGSTRSTAVIGTVSSNLAGIAGLDASPRTTPEANILHRMLRRLADSGQVTDVALEVSSHAMSMGRVNAVDFDLVAFTNLSQDHLDYHRTMEAYFAAKARLFDGNWAPRGVIWIDDPWGRRLATEAAIPVTTVGTDTAADVVVEYGNDTISGSDFVIHFAGKRLEVKTPLSGRFNVSNAAIALACAQDQGIDLQEAVVHLERMSPIPGRYNTVPTVRDLWVVVDYAHTPDAIASVIDESRALADGKIIVVAGAGGNRDREKRPLMGKAMALGDLAIVTTDNPRSEDPHLIADQVLSGIPRQSNVFVEADRRLAIRHALAKASSGDVVLILGKGHESTQEFADRTLVFDDNEVAREELERLEEMRT
jgi:UDP-N-acetylmuramoyl-L-alanyl-D-glutamate--2,6-diaminopimelate ligase